jgi:N-methylhydantoinase A
MGGTTAKVCLIDDYTPQSSRAFEVARVGRFKKGSGLPLRIPVVEMVEIGAGGGSLARVDTLGRIAVGPESAGADPGPACYSRGGTHPTVTDANLALGRYDPAHFAGGSLALDKAASRQALAADVGAALRLDIGMAALGIVETVDENMANATRVHAIESGKSCEGRTLIAFGGGGPVHGTRIAEKIGIGRVLVPCGAGVGSAIGFLRAPIAFEVVRSLYQRLSGLEIARVSALLADMAHEAAEVVAQGSFGAATKETRLAYMRYVGQGHEIAVPLPVRTLTGGDVAAIRAAYDEEYAKHYNRPVPGSDIEVMSYAVTVATVVPDVNWTGAKPVSYRPATAGARRVLDTASGRVSDWPVYDRAALAPGACFDGPAIIAEAETSTLVGPGWSGRITAEGYIDLQRKAADEKAVQPP